jgi:hypothetical protein
MNPRARIFTSCNLAYLPQAMILLASIRRFHDDCLVTLVLVEEKRKFPRLIQSRLDQFDQVMFPEDLWGDERFVHLFRYDVVEACTAVKGPALSRLLEDGLPVIYLDPDIALFSRLDSTIDQLEEASVILTPHQLSPMSHDRWGGIFDERTSLLTGVFNFGFLAVAPTNEGIEFARWWDYRTTTQSYDMPEAGLFTDQKWGNLVPALFPGTHISRHRGMNVASWNLHERTVHTSCDGTFMVDDDPLVFFHFTKGFNGVTPVLQKAMGNMYVASLWRWYLETLTDERSKIPSVKWSYQTYFDHAQSPIDKSTRRNFQPLGAPTRRVGNPFFRRNFEVD